MAQDGKFNISGCLWGGANMEVAESVNAKLQRSTGGYTAPCRVPVIASGGVGHGRKKK
jgi:NAD(P)H-dependent flavin oxidoreductase YrpB (nitropropane dioxygenase family)